MQWQEGDLLYKPAREECFHSSEECPRLTIEKEITKSSPSMCQEIGPPPYQDLGREVETGGLPYCMGQGTGKNNSHPFTPTKGNAIEIRERKNE
jgi:hypothetical protein